MNIYSSFIHNCQNLKATKISFGKQMAKQIMAHPYNEMLLSTKKKWKIMPWKDHGRTLNAYY